MSLVQDRILMASSAVLESIWMYAIVAVLGLGMGLGGSPLTWIAAVAILGISVIVARMLAIIIMHPMLPYILQMTIGVLVIYLTLGGQVQPEGQGFSLGWISALGAEDQPQDYRLMVGLTFIFGVILWWRGGRLASVEYPLDHLSRNFRIGLLILALAAIFEIVTVDNLHIFPLMFVFFGAGLAGLSAGNLMPASEMTVGARSWPRVISGIIVVVLLVGLLFSLMQKGFLNFISAPATVVLNALATVIFFIFIVPFVYLFEFLIRGFFFVFSKLAGEAEPLELETTAGLGETFRQAQEQAADKGPSMLLQFLEYTVLAILILAVLYFLARSFRRRVRWRRVDKEGVRESVAEDADAAMDLGRLLFNLLPERFRRKKARQGMRLPDDDADIVDVFRVYFGMLMLAEDRGHPRQMNQTPTEYQSTLQGIFPERIVRMVTDAFNRACYGHRPASRAQIDEMRQGLDRASQEE
ncbi:MAG: DUF4129 domain-containing protein [SAR202 cluster bacterium]|nr:DUF4129 domain-containing protein [SAR202 cluster bacterium]